MEETVSSLEVTPLLLDRVCHQVLKAQKEIKLGYFLQISISHENSPEGALEMYQFLGLWSDP